MSDDQLASALGGIHPSGRDTAQFRFAQTPAPVPARGLDDANGIPLDDGWFLAGLDFAAQRQARKAASGLAPSGQGVTLAISKDWLFRPGGPFEVRSVVSGPQGTASISADVRIGEIRIGGLRI